MKTFLIVLVVVGVLFSFNYEELWIWFNMSELPSVSVIMSTSVAPVSSGSVSVKFLPLSIAIVVLTVLILVKTWFKLKLKRIFSILSVFIIVDLIYIITMSITDKMPSLLGGMLVLFAAIAALYENKKGTVINVSSEATVVETLFSIVIFFSFTVLVFMANWSIYGLFIIVIQFLGDVGMATLTAFVLKGRTIDTPERGGGGGGSGS